MGVVGLVAGPVALVSGATASAVPNDSFTTVGAAQWKVPGGVSCATFDVYGAQGGTGGTYGGQTGGAGGLGGEVSAYVPVLAGTVYDLNVGARGTDGSLGTGGAGGAVGGGAGGGGEGAGGGGGGGMSRVSLSGTPLIIAAGGGGGGAAYDESHLGGAGGVDESAGTDGGVNVGQATAGGGATSSGGTAGANASFGGTEPTAGVATTGGTGGFAGDGGGGGGGGLYGGGGGGAGDLSGGAGGGGGADLVPLSGQANATHGVDAGNGGNGQILVSYTAGDTGCLLAPLTIKKATTGVTPTPGEQFSVHVSCPGGNIDGGSFGQANSLSSVDLAFTADGSGVVQPSSGYTFGFQDPDTCTVTETVNGGATETSYACSGSGASQPAAASVWGRVGAATASNPDDPCATSGPQSTPMTVHIVAPHQQATVTVTNTLVAHVVQPAPAQVIQPRFTG